MRVWIRRLGIAAALLAVLLLAGLEVLRWNAKRRGVVRARLPPGSELVRLSTAADYADAYTVPLSVEVGLDDVIAAADPGGVEIARSESEAVYRGAAPGLHFLLSLHVESSQRRLTLGTAVFYDSLLGRLYFLPVGIGHRRLVPFALERLAAALDAEARADQGSEESSTSSSPIPEQGHNSTQ